MKKLLGTTLVLLLLTTVANANRCLERASDEELLNEIAIRLNSGGGVPNNPDVSINFNCNSIHELIIESVNLNSGNANVNTIKTAGPYSCTKLIDDLARFFPEGKIVKKGIISVCNSNHELIKFVVSKRKELKEYSKTPTAGQYSCKKEQDAVNSRY